MEKIFSNPKINFYGGAGMLHKYVYMERETNNEFIYIIYKIENILNDKFPIKYQCSKYYELIISKNVKIPVTVNQRTEIELTNNDILYSITDREYIDLFRTFVESHGLNIHTKVNFLK